MAVSSFQKRFKIKPSTDERNVYLVFYREKLFKPLEKVATVRVTPRCGYLIDKEKYISSTDLSYLRTHFDNISGVSNTTIRIRNFLD